MRRVVATLAAATIACSPSAEFVQTEPAYIAAPRSRAPAVYEGREPTTEFEVVGYIDAVSIWAESDPDKRRVYVLNEGERVGCDLLVLRGHRYACGIIERPRSNAR